MTRYIDSRYDYSQLLFVPVDEYAAADVSSAYDNHRNYCPKESLVAGMTVIFAW